MFENIDRSKTATAKARSIRKKILQHKKRFRASREAKNNGSVFATTPSTRPIVLTTPPVQLSVMNAFSNTFKLGSSSNGSSQYSRMSDLPITPLVDNGLRTFQFHNQNNKENSFPTPPNINSVPKNNTPLADISSSIANQQSTTNQVKTQRTLSSKPVMPTKKGIHKPKIKHLQVNLASKFSSVTTSNLQVTDLNESHTNPSGSTSTPVTKRNKSTLIPADVAFSKEGTDLNESYTKPSVSTSTPVTKRKKSTLIPGDVASTQYESSDSSEQDSLNESSEDESSDEEGTEQHLGINCNSRQGFLLQLIISVNGHLFTNHFRGNTPSNLFVIQVIQT
jgi:hypothetical protein